MQTTLHLFKKLSRSADRKSTRLNSSHVKNSYAVFCLKKKKQSSSCIWARILSWRHLLDRTLSCLLLHYPVTTLTQSITNLLRSICQLLPNYSVNGVSWKHYCYFSY